MSLTVLASYAQDPAMQPFLAQSPPAHGTASPLASISEASQLKSSTPPIQHAPHRHPATFGPSYVEARTPGNTIAVLPSSLPDYHKAYMRGHPKSPPPSLESSSHDISGTSKQSPEQQAATARRLKPHSKSQANLEKLNKPEGMTPIQQPAKKPRATKWQFGIRSRNQPAEAMLAIYKALRAMGAEWEKPKPRRPGSADLGSDAGSSDDSSDDSDSDTKSPERESADRASLEQSNEQTGKGASHTRATNSTSSSASPRGRRHKKLEDLSRFSSENDWGYSVPADPWIINARFRKDGMHPIGIMPQSSTQSSRIDLPGDQAQSTLR